MSTFLHAYKKKGINTPKLLIQKGFLPKDETISGELQVNAAYALASWANDWPMALEALQLRNKDWPAQAIDGWLKIGNIYAQVAEVKDEAKALAAYRQALASASDAQKASTRAQISAVYQTRL